MTIKKRINVLAILAIIFAVIGTFFSFLFITDYFKDFSCVQIYLNNFASGDLTTILAVSIDAGIGLILAILALIFSLKLGEKRGIFWAVAIFIAFLISSFGGGTAATIDAPGSWISDGQPLINIPFIVYLFYFGLAIANAGAILAIVEFIYIIKLLRHPELAAEPTSDELIISEEPAAETATISEEEVVEESESGETSITEGEAVSDGDKEEEIEDDGPAAPSAVNISYVQEDGTTATATINKVYHVAKRQDGKWQVKAAKGQKAIKLFDTKVEAVNFANELAQRQAASVAVHASKGKNKGRIQKQ